MSVCFESNGTLASSVGMKTPSPDLSVTTPAPTCPSGTSEEDDDSLPATSSEKPTPLLSATSTKNLAKIIVTNNSIVAAPSVKVVNPQLITVLNSAGPITVVKSICGSSVVANAPQFTLVNSATPLTVTNALGKSPTITLLNTPVTVVKAIQQEPGKGREGTVAAVALPVSVSSNAGTTTPAASGETSAIHNVFVKNTCNPESGREVQETVSSHKLLATNAFPQNVLPNLPSPSSTVKTINGQKPIQTGKVKILSNVLAAAAPSSNPNNLLLNKTIPQQHLHHQQPQQQRFLPRQKLVSNGSTSKYLNKAAAGLMKATPVMSSASALKHHVQEKQLHRTAPYPTHKSQIKTMPPMNSYKASGGIKTLPAHQGKGIPGQVQRTGAGIRTIPPQRPQKIANRPNYIGKHAVQAQKVKGKVKGLKQPVGVGFMGQGQGQSQGRFQGNPVTFTQALTAEIIETLAHESGPTGTFGGNKCYEPPQMIPKYDNSYLYPERENMCDLSPKPVEDPKPQSSLNTLSLICHAVYLDHNYNATLPSDSPSRSPPPINVSPQLNGIAGNSMYSPGNSARSVVTSTSAFPTISNVSNTSLVPSNLHSTATVQEDDAASDISCVSDRKHESEGEETDTAPEAEAVNNDDQFEHYGDYVTRCICGFLHDDGYMIECDNCKVWQHVRCVVRNKQVPDEYLCEVCDPTKSVDRQKARSLQQQWMRETQLATEAKLRKEAKSKEHIKQKEMSDSDTSDGEQPTGNHMLAKGRIGQSNRKKSDTAQRQNVVVQRQRGGDVNKDSKKITKRKERKMVRRKPKPQTTKSHSDDDNQDPWISSQLPQLRQWIENYEEAVTNHYSPELRARISNIRINGAHSDATAITQPPDPNVNRCRIHTQPLTGLKYLVTVGCMQAHTPVVELRGKYMLSTQHRTAGGNAGGGTLTTRQHAQRPGPFLFFYRLQRDNTEVCVDTRTYGNSARFVRRSCKPNAELRHCIEKGVLHLYVVTLTDVEKNVELTIKHESHDLAAVGTTHIACACGNPAECLVNRSGAVGGVGAVKKNGESTEKPTYNHRKRRGRRTTSTSCELETFVSKVKEVVSPSLMSPVKEDVKQEVKSEPAVSQEVVKCSSEKSELKLDLEEFDVKNEKIEVENNNVKKEEVLHVKEEIESDEEQQSDAKNVSHNSVSTRRTSHKSDCDEKKEGGSATKEDKNKKLSREERKIEAIMKAFERMEKLQQRRQENQAKQAHRRESEPGPGKEDDRSEPKVKRRRRKGRARTVSTNSQAGRRHRVNSADSSYATSGDESLMSPNDGTRDCGGGQRSPDKAAGLLLSLSNGENLRTENSKSPPHDMDSNSNSAHSSPETPLSSACLLIAAAVGPLEPGFKFPKTKKGLMNEWLNKSDMHHSSSAISPSSLTTHHLQSPTDYDLNSSYYTPTKNLALSQVANFCESKGNAKKRWLRQAISEDQCDSPNSRPESPPLLADTSAPPKKRRLPRQSLSGNNSPATTPTGAEPVHIGLMLDEEGKLASTSTTQEGRVEIIYSGADDDSPTQVLESDAVLKERAAEMQQEFGARVRLPECQRDANIGCLMDPRLTRERALFSNSEHLVGTVEKTLSFLGFNDKKEESHLPAKRKLSITEYRQRKKMNVSSNANEESIAEESNLSQSPKGISERSMSTSTETSFASSDEETSFIDITDKKVPSAFNSEPTELERQRESVSLRLKKALGLNVEESNKKPAINVESLLSCDIQSSIPPKTTTFPLLPSPTYPIPGNLVGDVVTVPPPLPQQELPAVPPPPPPVSPPPPVPPPPPEDVVESEPEELAAIVTEAVEEGEGVNNVGVVANEAKEEEEEEEELVGEEEEEEEGKYEEVAATDYVPPFNNPLYPNDNFASYGSVIDDDVPYEGRNPSPPPELESGL